MASKNKATSEEILGATDTIDIPAVSSMTDDLDSIDVSKIDSILTSQDVQAGGKIRMERRGPTDQNFQYVCKIPVEQFDMDHIKKVFGGGDYRCQSFRANGQLYKPFNFAVDYRVRGSLDEVSIKMLSSEEGRKNAAADQASTMLSQMSTNHQQQLLARQGTNDMMQMFAMMNQKSDQMFTMMMAQASESQKTMATVMAAALGGRSQGIDPMMMKLLELQLTPKAPSDPSAQMSTLREMISLARELGGKEEKEEPSMMEKIFTAAAPMVAQMAANRQSVPAQVAHHSPPAQVIPTMRATFVQRPEAIQPPDTFKTMISLYLNQIIKAAERNGDPALYADIIADNLSDDKLEDVKQILTQANWREILFNNDARVVKHREWFEELRQLILSDGQQSDGSGAEGQSDQHSAIEHTDGSGSNPQDIGETQGQVSG